MKMRISTPVIMTVLKQKKIDFTSVKLTSAHGMDRYEILLPVSCRVDGRVPRDVESKAADAVIDFLEQNGVQSSIVVVR